MKTKRITQLWLITIAMIALLVLGATSSFAYESSLKAYWKMDDLSADDTFTGSNGSAPDPAKWITSGVAPTINSNALLCTSGTSQWSSSGVYFNNSTRLYGDFDLSVKFDATSMPNAAQNSHYLVLQLYGNTYSYAIEDYKSPSGIYAYYSWNTQTNDQFGTNSSNDSSGYFRMTRTGSTITGYKSTDGVNWTSFATISNADTSQMYAQVYVADSDTNGAGSAPTAKFDDFKVTNGERVSDATTANPGTIYGATQTTGKTGFGNALQFNGTSDSVQVANESNFDFERTSAFSISAWVKTSSSGTYQDVVAKMIGGYPYTGYQLSLTGDGKIGAFLCSDYANNNYLYETTTQSFNDNNWHLLTMSYDGSSSYSGLKIYVDGTLKTVDVSPYSLTGSILNNVPVALGRRPDGQYFTGSMDDTAIFSRTLAPDEIRYLASGNTTDTFENTYASAGPSNGAWDSTSTWRAGVEPTASHDVHIDSGAAITVGWPGEVCNNLYIGDASGESGTLNIAMAIGAGELTVSGNIYKGSGTSTININGGHLYVNGTSITTDNFNVGTSTIGQFTLANGKTLTATSETVGNSYIGPCPFNQTGGTNAVTGLTINGSGAYNLSGGTLDVGSSNISGIGTLTLSGTGVLDLADTTGTNSVGTFNVNKSFTLASGKTMNATTTESVSDGYTFTNSGGTNGVAGLNLNSSGTYALSAGTLDVGSSGISGTGTLTLSGTGVLDLADTTGTNTVGTFNVNKSFSLASSKIMNATTTESIGNSYTFINSGGVNTVGGLNLNTSGIYTLNTGGTLSVGSSGITGTGTLNLSGGTFSLGGSFSGPSLNLSSGTIKGSGTFTNTNFTIGDNVIQSPGNSPGTQTISGGTETWDGGGTYLWQIFNPVGTAGSEWDLISLTNSATLNIIASESDKFNIAIQGLSALPDTIGNPSGFNVNSIYSWLIVGNTGSTINGFMANKFNITVSGISGVQASSFYLTQDANGITMHYQTGGEPLGGVPEPATVAGLAAAFILFASRRVLKRARA